MQKDEDLESLRENIIHGLRMQGWPKADAEDEAHDRIRRIVNKNRASPRAGRG